jgi:hypothetical protein
MLLMGWRDSAVINATYGRPSSILLLSTDDFISVDASGKNGGPSRDRELKLSSLEDIQRRGHGSISASVRNY